MKFETLKVSSFLTAFTVLLIPLSTNAQQLSFHVAAAAPLSLITLSTAASDEDRGATPSYLSSVSLKSDFHPNADDLLVSQAEQKFEAGRQAYQANDLAGARRNFDEAIDLMLQASGKPSDRQLYESKMDHMVDAIHRLDLARLGAAVSDQEPQFEKAPLDPILQMTFPVDPSIKSKVMDEVKSTTSQLPLVVNDTVLSYIHYFSGRGHATIVAGLQRAGRYRPMIERVLREEGVPLELIHLAQAESGFLPRAVSYRAATGMWQFIKYRGNEYGLHQSGFTDDRLDPEKATRAAARHLHDLYDHFGNWYLAIAAYNCGPNAVDHAIERTGYADYWELRARHAIPNETSNYVPIILAMTIMTKNAAEYDLQNITPEAPLEYETVRVDSPTHLALVGDVTDTPVSELSSMNPALLRPIVPAGYELHLPKGSGTALTTALASIPAERRLSWRMHRVQSGETLLAIARHYNTAANEIASINKLDAETPNEGDRLLIPAAYHSDVVHAKAARRGIFRAPSHRVVTHPRAHSRGHMTVSTSRVSTHRTMAHHSLRHSARVA